MRRERSREAVGQVEITGAALVPEVKGIRGAVAIAGGIGRGMVWCLRLDRSPLRELYRSLLVDGIAPFWLEKGVDREHGGVLSCMSEDGRVRSGDKYMWSQARSVWTFAALYNRVEARPEYLEAAANSVRFLLAHGRNAEGDWIYRTDREGREIEGAESIYSDCFAVYGLSEYYRAVRDPSVLEIAEKTLARVFERVDAPGFAATAPYTLPAGWKTHAVPMILTEVANELLVTTGRDSLESEITRRSSEIFERHVQPERRRLVEYLAADWSPLPGDAGEAVMPGHAIESMWFVMHVGRRRGDRDLIRRAAEVLRWHVEAGWDPVYGGLFLGLGGYIRNADKKLWWPHTEALYALLLAQELTGESWCGEWYERVHDWSFRHFQMPSGGEWWQRLTREGQPTDELIALPVKDPFHLPRAAILICQLLGGK